MSTENVDDSLCNILSLKNDVDGSVDILSGTVTSGYDFVLPNNSGNNQFLVTDGINCSWNSITSIGPTGPTGPTGPEMISLGPTGPTGPEVTGRLSHVSARSPEVNGYLLDLTLRMVVNYDVKTITPDIIYSGGYFTVTQPGNYIVLVSSYGRGEDLEGGYYTFLNKLTPPSTQTVLWSMRDATTANGNTGASMFFTYIVTLFSGESLFLTNRRYEENLSGNTSDDRGGCIFSMYSLFSTF